MSRIYYSFLIKYVVVTTTIVCLVALYIIYKTICYKQAEALHMGVKYRLFTSSLLRIKETHWVVLYSED